LQVLIKFTDVKKEQLLPQIFKTDLFAFFKEAAIFLKGPYQDQWQWVACSTRTAPTGGRAAAIPPRTV
jgi:hypothetical protein